MNNPVRVPRISPSFSAQQRDKGGWADLIVVLDTVENRADPEFTANVFKQVLVETYRRLSEIQIDYPAPLRISAIRTLEVVRDFLLVRSRGDREQAVASALFSTIGREFELFAAVRRAVINASDASSGLVADLECVDETGAVVIAVEVKDKELTVGQIKSKLERARAARITELLFIAQKDVLRADVETVRDLQESEFAGGQNVHILDLMSLASVAFALMREEARPEFLRLVGKELDDYRSAIHDRRAWRELLIGI